MNLYHLFNRNNDVHCTCRDRRLSKTFALSAAAVYVESEYRSVRVRISMKTVLRTWIR